MTTRLQKQAKVNRGLACLKYLQARSTPATTIELAEKLKVSSRSIQNSLEPLILEGKIIRGEVWKQSSPAKKAGLSYSYLAADSKVKKKILQNGSVEEVFDINFNNPFNLRAS
jgi:predicted transcriptional regulator